MDVLFKALAGSYYRLRLFCVYDKSTPTYSTTNLVDSWDNRELDIATKNRDTCYSLILFLYKSYRELFHY